jgi:hypothetical protein
MSNIQDFCHFCKTEKQASTTAALKKKVALTEVPVTLLTVVISTRYSIMLIVFSMFCVGKEAIQWGVNVFRVA